MFGWLAAVCLYWILLGCLNVWMAGSRMPLLDIGVLNYWLYIEIVLLYSELILKRDYLHSLQSPRGPIGDPRGTGTGTKLAPLSISGTGRGMGFGDRVGDGDRSPGPSPPRCHPDMPHGIFSKIILITKEDHTCSNFIVFLFWGLGH